MEELSFGNWLKRRRRGLGLTQNELAHRAGYSGETIRKVEADALRPSRQMAEKLADHLDIAPGERAAFIHFARDETGGELALPSFPTRLARPHASLPVQSSQLIGRETDTAALRQLLLTDGVRLISLLGPPGIGKTRLAVHTATLLEDAFADGVAFVALAQLDEPGLVAGEMALALGVREAGGQPLNDRLKSYLRDRQMLLVIDNFEHVLPAAAQVAELLAACPRIKVLATSRAALHLAGEHEFEVPALGLPRLSPLPPLDILATYPAVALYVQRTQAIKPSFCLTEANAANVAAICIHLDGLPLAIELAAARGKLFSPATLLVRLAEHERMAVLTGDARDRSPRQQTLRGTIDWSYNLLTPAAQALFARLAIFAGGCTLEAAEAVCGAEPVMSDGPATRRTGSSQTAFHLDRLHLDGSLGVLVDQSLVRQSDGPDGEKRFWMLETLREYALERLAEAAGAERLGRQHAEYYMALAESAHIETSGAEQGRWLNLLAVEHDNFRAALAWSLTAVDGVELGLRLAEGLGSYWIIRSHWSEGQTWLAELLSRSSDSLSPLRFEGLLLASQLAWFEFNYERQEHLAREALAAARQLGSPQAICQALQQLSQPLIICGDYAAARALGEESLALARAAGRVWDEAKALQTLGIAARNQDDFAAAAEFSRQALALAPKCGDRKLEAHVQYGVGLDAWNEGHFMQAVACFDRSIQLFHELGDKRMLGVLWWALGRVALDQSDLVLATRHFRQSLNYFRESEFILGLCGYLLGMAGVATARGQAAAAVRLSATVDALRSTLGHRLEPYLAARYARQLDQARAQLNEATFSAAWAAGQALTPEQAVEEALAQEVAGPASVIR